MADAEIDYIDLESLKVAESDAQWTIPRGQGGVVQMEEFKANLGQPIYIQGMFFGCEFPAADTEIVNGTGFMRYYSGKTFSRLKEDNQLTTDDKYVTWQTVAGAVKKYRAGSYSGRLLRVHQVNRNSVRVPYTV